jgi:hypothetical protein
VAHSSIHLSFERPRADAWTCWILQHIFLFDIDAYSAYFLSFVCIVSLASYVPRPLASTNFSTP